MAQFSRVLLKLYAQGELTGTQVQQMASAAWEDGWGRGDAIAGRLRALGSGGTHVGNITRNLMALARQHNLLSSGAHPYQVQLPGNQGKVGVFLPHEVAFHIARPGLTLTPGQVAEEPLGRLLQDWGRHGEVNFQGALSEVIVIGLHADGVAYTSSVRAGGQRSIIVGSWNVLSAQDAGDRHQRHVLFILQKDRLCSCGCQGYHSIQAIFSVVSWSLRCALSGFAPHVRHDTTPFEDNERDLRLPHGVPLPPLALLQVRGDWEWMVTAFRFRSYNSASFCWLCDAETSGPLTFHDFRTDARHRETLIDHNSYILGCAQQRVQPSALFECPGLLLRHVCVDSMHAGDLGVFQDAIGSLFHLEVGNKRWHATRAQGCIWLNNELTKYYQANPGLSRLTPLSLRQLQSSTSGGGAAYPTLRAKAAMTRQATEFARILAYQHRDGTDSRPRFTFPSAHRLYHQSQEHATLVTRLFDHLALYHRACLSEPFDPDLCKSSMLGFLQTMTLLHEMWRSGVPESEHQALPWKLRKKAHMLQHLVCDQLQLWGSPSSFWCYRDEDWIGVVKRIAARSHHPHTLEERVAQKLMLAAGLGCL